jgi:hypothetical protein
MRLQLIDNKLIGMVPSEIASLTQLIEINFHSSSQSYRNCISGDFPSVAAITGLRVLALSGNQITSLPLDLWQNSHLEILDASNNALTVLPENLGLLVNLKILRLGDNQIKDVFPTAGICNLKNIYILNLANSALSGSLPTCISQLNPAVFDISTLTTGVSGEVPIDLIKTWTNINMGYLSVYGNFNITGAIAGICVNFRHCYNSTYAAHADLTWVTQMGQVPQIVIDTLNIAKAR